MAINKLVGLKVKLSDLDKGATPADQEVVIAKVYDLINAAGYFVQTKKATRHRNGYLISYRQAFDLLGDKND